MNEKGKIRVIDAIVSPLFDLDKSRKSNLGLLERIKLYAKTNGHDRERLFFLDPGSVTHFEPFQERYGAGYNEVVQEYNSQLASLIMALRNSTTHLFIGNEKDVEIYPVCNDQADRPHYLGRLNFFLREKDLELDVSRLELIGHGLHRGVCVLDFLEKMMLAVVARHKKQVPYRENEATTL